MVIQRYIVMAALFCAALFSQSGFNGPGQYKISNAENGKVLDMSGGALIQVSGADSPDQVWYISDADGGYYYIRNAANGNALEESSHRNSSPVMVNPYSGSDTQKWKIESSHGHAMIVSRSGRALDVPEGTKREAARMQTYDKNGEGNQRFTFMPQSGSWNGGAWRSGANSGWGNANPAWSDTRNSQPGQSGRYWDERDRMFKLTGDGVCFYREPNYGGGAMCLQSGMGAASIANANPGQFESMKIFGRSRGIEIFSGPNYQGDSFRITHDDSDLRKNSRWAAVNSGMASIRVD